MMASDEYPLINETVLDEGTWTKCIVCGKAAMIFKNRVPLCRYCAAEGY